MRPRRPKSTNPLRRRRSAPSEPVSDPAPARILALCREMGLHPPSSALPPLCAYLRRMLEWNRRVNLSGIRDFDAALCLHVVDSLQVLEAVEAEPRCVVDLGSGNGFPGVAAAVLWPEARVVLVERTRKKARAIRACLEASKLGRVEVAELDASQIPAHEPSLLGTADLCLSRATASLDRVNAWARPLCRPGGRICHWKAAHIAPEERRRALAGPKVRGLRSLADLPYRLPPPSPGGEARERRLIRYFLP